MPVPAFTVLSPHLDRLKFIFPDALTDEVETDFQQPEITGNQLFTGTAGDDSNTTLIDTGNLAAGVYRVRGFFNPGTASTTEIDFQHRNAADNGTIASVRFQTATNRPVVFEAELRVLLNESLRLVLVTDIANGVAVTAVLFLDRIAL